MSQRNEPTKGIDEVHQYEPRRQHSNSNNNNSNSEDCDGDLICHRASFGLATYGNQPEQEAAGEGGASIVLLIESGDWQLATGDCSWSWSWSWSHAMLCG
ncbi:hypothetical protein AWZ03_007958 [Drosophila navojoa]|uniref:Uncharacterized protein n=1 Tax=Drosophila navojoa TaxID=7232 RepID=A0A484BA38_DRONA|nr:hypothetical protein AWZ03_007958 [Drosophila navojoa]